MENQVGSFFPPVVVLPNIVSIIEPRPKITVSDAVSEPNVFDPINVIFNGHFVLEPMVEQMHFHDFNLHHMASCSRSNQTLLLP